MRRRTRPHRRAAWLISLLVLVALTAAPAWGAAQEDAPTTAGFRPVAQVPAADWPLLAREFAPSFAGTPGPGDATPDTRTPPETLAGRELVDALRGGGFVLYVRHAATDRTQADTGDDLRDCATQRNLDAQGRADAAAIGRAFAHLGIPVGRVLSSEFCRARDTAELAFGGLVDAVEVTADLTGRARVAGDPVRAERIAALQRYLATPPTTGTNTVLVGHGFNIADAAGLTLGEGETAVFLPLASPGTPGATG